jgi:hypothetical protein
MPWGKRAVAVVFLLVFAMQSFFASRVKSPTFDEPAHIAAGLSYLSTGVFHANLQHPPLLKELSAIGMLLGGVRWPNTPAAAELIAHETGKPSRDWDVGNDILASQGPDRVLFWARWPMILVSLLLGAAIYWWGRDLLGEGAALGALFLFALDPTVLGHSFLVTTDVGLAAFTILFLGALWKHTREPSLKQQVWCGVALGCALGAKFSAVLLLPIAALLLFAAALWPPGGAGKRIPKAEPNQPCPCGSGRKYKACHGAEQGGLDLLPQVRAFAVMCAVALVAIEILYLFRAGPSLYLEGIRRVNADHDPNYLAFFAGEVRKSFVGYFAAAYLLKAPIAAILLTATGAMLLLRRKTLPVLAKLFLFLPPVVLFAAYSWGASNMGIRYIIPVLPFAYLAGGAALAWLFGRPAAWARAIGAALCLWMTIAAAGIYPDHLSYFNESACVLDGQSPGLDGGSRCGPLWLDDSNVDWGQGLKQLKIWLDAHAAGRPVHLLYHGSFPPEKYGIQATEAPPVPNAKPELYVISGHYLARLGVTEERVRTTKPLAIVGHSLWVFEF